MGVRVSGLKATGLVLLAVAGGSVRAQSLAGHTLMASNSVPSLRVAAAAPASPAPAAPTLVASTKLPTSTELPKLSPLEPLKPSHLHPLTVERGVLTVNGLTAKVNLNYQIADLRYLYIYVPGVGTTVISDAPFAGAAEQKNAFDGEVLTVNSGGNKLQLTAAHKLLGKRAAYVKFDPTFGPSSRMPVVGYGETAAAPYAWPGALKEVHTLANTHPVPPSMKPILQRETVCNAAGQGATEGCATAIMTVAYNR